MYLLSAKTEAPSLFESLWNYLRSNFDRVDENYSNLGTEKNPLFSLRFMILGIFIGAAIACIVMAYNKLVIGSFVRRLIRRGCNSAENSKTLQELGFSRSPIAKHAFMHNHALRRLVRCVGEDAFYEGEQDKTKKYYIDFASDRFYIPDEQRIAAELRYEKKGSGWISSVIGMIVLAIIFFLLIFNLPMIMNAINDFVGSFKK